MEFAILAVPFLFALFVALPTTPKFLKREYLTWLSTAILSGLFVWLLTYYPTIRDQGYVVAAWEWVPALNLTFSIYLDGLALIFALIVTGIGAMVILYAGYYFETDEQTQRFFALFFAFTGSMLGVVLSGNLLLLFIFWEGTSLLSFALIGFKGKLESARFGASQALIITGGGGLALLAGLMLLGVAAGSFEWVDIFATLKNDQTLISDHAWYTAIMILIALGAFTKSAQYPFHFWLPGAMAAPSPASAFLHSATMVKAGVFILLRLYPALGNTDLWETTLLSVGLLTLFVGAALAIKQVDLKGILAYTTISMLGALVALTGLDNYAGMKAALIGVVGHALYKSTFFLLAGVIDHATGTRDIRQLYGLYRKMPLAAYTSIGVGLSMAGVIPFLGFVAKETLIEAALSAPQSLLITAIVVLSSIFTVVAVLLLVWDVYFRRSLPASIPHQDTAHDEPHHFHAPSLGLLVGPMVLAAASLILGIGLEWLIKPLIEITVPKSFKLLLFPGINTAFILSTLVLIGGTALFLARSTWLRLPDVPLRGTDVYLWVIRQVDRIADLLLTSQNGKLRHYLIVILAAIILFMVAANVEYISGDIDWTIEITGSEDLLKIGLLLLSIASASASVFFKRHLPAALALGVMGYAVAGLFLLQPAPDVALVQFLVETLGTVLIVIMLYRLNRQHRQQVIENLWNTSRLGILRDIFIASAIGLGVGLFAISAVGNRGDREAPVAQWYAENTASEAGVDDIVSAVVADFRATDTLIEIMVFSMAALGVFTLLSLKSLAEKSPEKPTEALPIIATPLTRLIVVVDVLPFALLIALAHVLYAGDLPGDGFTAGVIGGLGVTVWYVVFGYAHTQARLQWLNPPRLITVGLLIAFVNALLPLLFDRPFFALTKWQAFPDIANLAPSSTMIFEFSIFITVLGAISLIMATIIQPSSTEEASA